MEFLSKNPERIMKLIYDNVPAPRELVKAAFDSLVSTGDIRSKQKPGTNGTMTVFFLRPENDDAPPVVAVPRISLSALAEAAGLARSTVQYQRSRGKSDEEIIALGRRS